MEPSMGHVRNVKMRTTERTVDGASTVNWETWRTDSREYFPVIFNIGLQLLMESLLTLSITDLPGLGSDEWFLPAIDGITFKVKIEYIDPNVKVQDVDVASAPPEALFAFLEQFQDINSRWINEYELVTEEIINECVSFQTGIVSKILSSGGVLYEEDLIVAHALRTLALAHAIMDVQANVSYRSVAHFHQHRLFAQPEKLQTCCEPSIELSRSTKKAAMSKKTPDLPRFSSMVQDVVRIAQGMILRGTPSDFPAIFCALCLLRLVESNCGDGNLIPYIAPLDPGRVLKNVYWTLCQMFDITIKGKHPLSDEWNPNGNTKVDGKSSQENELFQAMNNIWVGAGKNSLSTHRPLLTGAKKMKEKERAIILWKEWSAL